mmetsp:Transcript_55918/g.134024  ORF Transcript_55918/g.134024 Transcript_55918/m.134024 type:complete len:215 (+) Transcript_55918:193-837(+)
MPPSTFFCLRRTHSSLRSMGTKCGSILVSSGMPLAARLRKMCTKSCCACVSPRLMITVSSWYALAGVFSTSVLISMSEDWALLPMSAMTRSAAACTCSLITSAKRVAVRVACSCATLVLVLLECMTFSSTAAARASLPLVSRMSIAAAALVLARIVVLISSAVAEKATAVFATASSVASLVATTVASAITVASLVNLPASSSRWSCPLTWFLLV